MGKLTLPRSAITEALGGDEVIRAGGTEGSPMPKCQNNNIVIYVDGDSWSKFWVHKKQHGICPHVEKTKQNSHL